MTYSAKIKGDKTNYNWPVEFGRESQTVGITQWCDGEFTERVLLWELYTKLPFGAGKGVGDSL